MIKLAEEFNKTHKCTYVSAKPVEVQDKPKPQPQRTRRLSDASPLIRRLTERFLLHFKKQTDERMFHPLLTPPPLPEKIKDVPRGGFLVLRSA
jgi:hypothetical protein